MNIKELITSQPIEEITAALADLLAIAPERREQAMDRLVTWIDGLNAIQPVETGCLLLGIICINNGEEYLEVRLYRKTDLQEYASAPSELDTLEEDIQCLDEEALQRLASSQLLPEAYGFEFSPWAEILGYEVAECNVRDVGGA